MKKMNYVDHERYQDESGDWYWIPIELVDKFQSDLEAISEINYMDNPQLINQFNEDYDIYRTGGDVNQIPDFFKQKK